MSNPAQSASEIDWDKIATRLSVAFDSAMGVAEKHMRYNDSSIDTDFRNAIEIANATAAALAKISSEARAHRDAKDKDNFKISKP